MDRTRFEALTWELSVLTRAVHYPNLSGAALHVGLSQPQLSRIIAKLEAELEVVLLDRQVKRKSTWTPVAQMLAETFVKASDKLASDLQKVIQGHLPKEVQIGTLEGLGPLGVRLAHQCLAIPGIRRVELDVYDLNVLEELFLSGSLDLILTSREPGRKKFQNFLELGFQTLETVSMGTTDTQVVSGFEYQKVLTRRPLKGSRSADTKNEPGIFISNSLAMRKIWLEWFGGRGSLPSAVRARRNLSDDIPVLLIASDKVNPELWKKIRSFRADLREPLAPKAP